MSNLQTHYHFKLDFQKVDQYKGGKWLIHGTKHSEDNQLQSLELPCRSPKVTYSLQYWKRMSRGRNIQEGAYLQNQNYLLLESPNV